MPLSISITRQRETEPLGLSIRAYAKQRGVSDTAVRKAIKSGRITVGRDGKIDPRQADRQWAENTDPGLAPKQHSTNPQSERGSPPPGEVRSALSDARARKLRAETERIEMANAKEREDLLPRAEIHQAMTAAFARVRAKLLGLPTRIAPIVVGIRSPAVVKQRITEAIHEALKELATTQVTGPGAIPRSDGSTERGN